MSKRSFETTRKSTKGSRSKESRRSKKRQKSSRSSDGPFVHETPGELVSLVQQRKITDLCTVDKTHVSNCISLLKSDIYFSAAVAISQIAVLQGGVAVCIGRLTYPNFKVHERTFLEAQLKKVLAWFFCTGFCPFSYDNPHYIPRYERKQIRYFKRAMKRERSFSGGYNDGSGSDDDDVGKSSYKHPGKSYPRERPTQVSYVPMIDGRAVQGLAELENNANSVYLARETMDVSEVIDRQAAGTYRSNGKENKDKSSDKNTDEEETAKRLAREIQNAQQIKLEDDFLGEKSKEFQKESSIMQHADTPGLSSIDTTISKEVQEFMAADSEDSKNGGLSRKGTTNGGITPVLYDMAMSKRNQLGNLGAPDTMSNEDRDSQGIPGQTTFPVFQTRDTSDRPVVHVDKVSQYLKSNSTPSFDARRDLEFDVPDVDANLGTFIRYRDIESGSVKIFFVSDCEDSDEESSSSSSSSSSLSSSDDEESGDDGFSYGTSDEGSYKSRPGYDLKKHYVTYPNGRRKRIGNMYDFPSRIDDGYIYNADSSDVRDPLTGFGITPVERNRAYVKSQQIRDKLMSDGVVWSNDMVLKQGEYMPDETPDSFLGMRTNARPIGNRMTVKKNSEGKIPHGWPKHSYKDRLKMSGQHRDSIPSLTDNDYGYGSPTEDDDDDEEARRQQQQKRHYSRKNFKALREREIRQHKRKMSRRKKIYMVFTFNPPSSDGKLDSYAAKLIKPYAKCRRAENTEEVYDHRLMYPIVVFQDINEDKTGGGKSSSVGGPDSVNFQKIAGKMIKDIKADEVTSQGLRGISTIAEKYISTWVDKFTEAQQNSKLASMGGDPNNPNGGRTQYHKIPTPEELKREQEQRLLFQKKANEIHEDVATYTEAYNNNTLSSISPDLALKMNALYAPKGTEYKAVLTPNAPTSALEIEDIYIRKVCTLFGIPKRRLDDSEGSKWKPDVQSDSSRMIERLVPVRDSLKSLFTGFYISKHGVILSKQNEKWNKFVKEEMKMVDATIDKILTLAEGLGFFYKKSLDQFVDGNRKQLTEQKKRETQMRDLDKLKGDVDKAILNDRKNEIEKKKNAPPAPASGSGKSGQPKKNDSPPLSSEGGTKNGEKDGSGEGSESSSTSGSGGGANAPPMAEFDLSSTEMQTHERQRELLIIQKLINFATDAFRNMNFTIDFVEQYQASAISLQFRMPMVGDLQDLQQINEIVPMADNKIREFIMETHGTSL